MPAICNAVINRKKHHEINTIAPSLIIAPFIIASIFLLLKYPCWFVIPTWPRTAFAVINWSIPNYMSKRLAIYFHSTTVILVPRTRYSGNELRNYRAFIWSPSTKAWNLCLECVFLNPIMIMPKMTCVLCRGNHLQGRQKWMSYHLWHWWSPKILDSKYSLLWRSAD